MTPLLSNSELRTILSRGEGQFVEFKSTWDLGSSPAKHLWRRALRDKIADVVAAFANADGGLLLVGVNDDGAVSGHGYSERDVAAFFEVPSRRLAPAPECRTARFTLDGHEILAFQVPISTEAVMIGGNGFPYRVGSLIVREPQEVMEADFGYLERIGSDESWTLTRELRRRILDADEESEGWAALKGRALQAMRRCNEIGDPPLANLDVRRITGLDRHQVRRLVGELRAQGLVTLSGRGRGTRYVYVGPQGSSQ